MDEPLHCVNHPAVETRLRCNKCGRPICVRCAVRTPVGYRCRDCVAAQQQAFYAGFQPSHYLMAGGIALPLSLLAGWLVPQLGWYAIFLGPVAGSGIAEAARWAVKRRRGEHTWLVVCAAIVTGGLPAFLLWLISLLGFDSGGSRAFLRTSGGIMRLIWIGVYLVTATGAAYARLRVGKRL